ncbi:DNA repair protein RecN, partial [Verrucomicrobiota bacterium]
GDLLVDMHGPHDHQSLLSQDFQMDLLDSFANLQESRVEYEKIYRDKLNLENQRRALDGDDHDVEQQIDMLSFQVKEIEDAGFNKDDEDGLEQQHTLAANAQRVLELTGSANNSLMEDESSVYNTMLFVRKSLGELKGILDDADEWQSEADSINIQIQELSKSIAGRVHNLEVDPERMQWLEDRMALIHKLKRKYGSSVKEINEFLAKTKARLDNLSSRGEKIEELDSEIEKIMKKLLLAGDKLGKKRRSAAEKLGKAITKQLCDLGFKHGVFNVALEKIDPCPSGLDRIEFGFAPNVGESLRPLRVIASSGEISRVMLATKSVLAEHDRIPLLVFDEIDSNVGGEMGMAIGDKLAVVAKKHQVICITHLPQVAVQGTSHYIVAKEVRDKRTRTSISLTEGEERVEEVARMLGGKDLTSVTLTHAREMLGSHIA